jgi:hypothetical protein
MHIIVHFQTSDNIPAPFAHEYQMTFDTQKSEANCQLILQYFGREELTEDEIFADGFTLNDDYVWNGHLHKIWLIQLENLVKKSNWRKSDAPALSGNWISLTIDGVEKYPSNADDYEYLCQELLQAIFETSGKEAPLEIKYCQIYPDQHSHSWQLKVMFGIRQASLSITKGAFVKERKLSWDVLKEELQWIYTADYLTEKAADAAPTRKGRYITFGDGLWYEFGKSAINPQGNSSFINQLQKRLDKYFE